MKGLGMWTRVVVRGITNRCALLKTRRKIVSEGMFLLSKKEPSSGSGESAAVHFVQSDLTNFSDEVGKSDYDPAVVRTVEMLSVTEGDASVSVQEKETRSSRGIPSR
jgi:hypothetical protein